MSRFTRLPVPKRANDIHITYMRGDGGGCPDPDPDRELRHSSCSFVINGSRAEHDTRRRISCAVHARAASGQEGRRWVGGKGVDKGVVGWVVSVESCFVHRELTIVLHGFIIVRVVLCVV